MGILDRFLGKKKVETPSIEVEVSEDQPTADYSPYNIQKLPNGDYLINPGASFELTLYNADKDKIDLFVDALNQSMGELIEILTVTDIRCREIDAYVDEYRPKYEKLVKELIEKHPDWKDANERDKKDILKEVRQTALSMVEMRPNVELGFLFEYYPLNDPLPRNVLQKYPIDAISKYVRVWDNEMKVKIVSADNADRRLYEQMVDLGLAIRGREISTEKILMTMKMDQLRDISSKFDIKIPRKKEEAAKTVAGIEGINEHLDKYVSFRELFQLVPLPEEFKDIEIDMIGVFLRYCSIIADLIERTYSFARHIDQKVIGYQSYGINWEASCTNDSCPYCKQQVNKKNPKPPFHLACRCAIVPKIT